MLLRLMFVSDTMAVGFGLCLSKDLGMGEWKLDLLLVIYMLNNWVYHGWEGHIGVIMINVYLPLIALAKFS